MKTEWHNIRIRKETAKILKEMVKYNESYDKVIRKLIKKGDL